jgi:hypothetical protein
VFSLSRKLKNCSCGAVEGAYLKNGLDAKYTGNFKSCSLEYLENAIAISEKYLEFSQKDKSTSEKRKYNKKPKTNDVPIWSYANSDDFWAGKITLNRA